MERSYITHKSPRFNPLINAMKKGRRDKKYTGMALEVGTDFVCFKQWLVMQFAPGPRIIPHIQSLMELSWTRITKNTENPILWAYVSFP